MALIVETGTGRDDAESFNSVIELDARATAKGARYASWLVLADSAKEAAAREGIIPLLPLEPRFLGTRLNDDQRLPFPRVGCTYRDGRPIAEDAIPWEIREAHFELSFRASVAALLPDLKQGGAVKKVKVGPIEKEMQDGAAGGTARPQVAAILAPLIGASSGRWI
jgi:hypothetical protein